MATATWNDARRSPCNSWTAEWERPVPLAEASGSTLTSACYAYRDIRARRVPVPKLASAAISPAVHVCGA
jgi:hypothetical protein